MSNEIELILAEPPFVSIQGEGKTINKFSYFVRFFGCNLRCSFCDSKFSFDSNTNTYKTDVFSLELNFLKSGVSNIIFTGGEPLLYQSNIIKIFERLVPSKYSIEIETNGSIEMTKEFLFFLSTIPNKSERVLINISPKIIPGMEKTKEIQQIKENIFALTILGIPYILKFVYDDKDDKREYIEDSIINFKNYLSECKIFFNPSTQIYVMPECTTREEHIKNTQKVLDFCRKNDFNFSPRLHILLWDNKRGV